MELQSKSVSEFADWLMKEGFSEKIAKIFEDNEMDGEAFLLQTDDDIKDLVPLYGPRAKLIKIRNEVGSKQQARTVGSSQSVIEVQNSLQKPLVCLDSSNTTESPPANNKSILADSSDLFEETVEFETSDNTSYLSDCEYGGLDCITDSKENDLMQANKRPKLEQSLGAVKKAPTFLSKRKQEPPLPKPFQLPTNINPDLATSLESERPSCKAESKIAGVVADAVFFHKSYPTTPELVHVAEQMVKRWPNLLSGGTSSAHLVELLREKFNYRRKPDKKRAKGKQGSQPYKPKCRQMPTRVTFQESASTNGTSTTEDKGSHDRHVKLLKQECKKANPNKIVCKELMKRTYYFRRPAVLDGFTVDHILSEYPALRYPDEILHEYDRIYPEYDSEKVLEQWSNLVPTILQIAINEGSEDILTLTDGEADFSEEYRSVVAICALYYLLPDARTVKNHTRIITLVEDTAAVNEIAVDAFSPQPCIIVRKSSVPGEIKDAFLLIQRKPLSTKLDPKKMVAVLFASFTVFNVHFTEGCTNFFTLLEVLFLNKKVPPRKPRLATIASKLK